MKGSVTAGILGGTFDPPHLGHLWVAQEVRARLGLREVRLVVASDPWQKTQDGAPEGSITPAEIRVELCHLLVVGHEGVRVDDVELTLGGETVTMRTLDHLRTEEPDVDWVVIVGADTAARLPTWRQADRLAAEARFAVVGRPGGPAAGSVLPEGFRGSVVEIPRIEVSSTDIRRRVADGEPISHLVGPAVANRIAELGLYR